MTKKYLWIVLAIWIAAACTQQKPKKTADGKAFRQQLKEGIRKWLSNITETSITTDEEMNYCQEAKP